MNSNIDPLSYSSLGKLWDDLPRSTKEILVNGADLPPELLDMNWGDMTPGQHIALNLILSGASQKEPNSVSKESMTILSMPRKRRLHRRSQSRTPATYLRHNSVFRTNRAQ